MVTMAFSFDKKNWDLFSGALKQEKVELRIRSELEIRRFRSPERFKLERIDTAV